MKVKNITQYIDESTEQGSCCWKGCSDEGQYPAPKSNDGSSGRYNFCLDHVRIYNKSWDFFRGMHQDEIEKMHKDVVYGHRTTRKMGVESYFYDTDQLRDNVFEMFGFAREEAAKQKKPSIDDNEIKAFKALGFNRVVSWEEIKKRYKELAKTYHPDVSSDNDGDKFKIINQAYNFLKKIYG
ncbi:J domain-containing protein [Rickettsiales bacterium]|nr:J domain-containing protein [Rickettsiales bacterium]